MSVRVAWVSSLMLAAGCGSRDLSELTARLDATFYPDEIQLTLSLYVTETWYAETGEAAEPHVIEPDEHLLVRYRDQVSDLAYGEWAYYGSIRLDDEVRADETLTLTYERPGGDGTSFSMYLPPSFRLTPSQDSASGDIVLTWAPTSDDRMGWRATEACNSTSHDGPIPRGTDMLTIPAHVLGACDVTLSVDRWRWTEADSAFGSSGMYATHTRLAAFEGRP